jgi:hypothetical protein
MKAEEYIEHEVKLRVHDEKFRILEHKMNCTMGLVVGGWIVPIVLHFLKLA